MLVDVYQQHLSYDNGGCDFALPADQNYNTVIAALSSKLDATLQKRHVEHNQVHSHASIEKNSNLLLLSILLQPKF